MQCCPLEDLIWWNYCCCYAPWLILFSCYPLLNLALLFFPRNSGPLQPLTTHDLAFSFPSRSSILNLVYLYYFKSLISDFHSCSIPLSRLSNSIGLTQFGFFKREFYPISHNALIMGCFSRVNLYVMPRITVPSFGSKIDREKAKVCALSSKGWRGSVGRSRIIIRWLCQSLGYGLVYIILLHHSIHCKVDHFPWYGSPFFFYSSRGW